jgi:hypothetical protein
VNLRKHVAGFALFFFIVSSAILIKIYLTAPIATIIPDQDTDNPLQVSTDEPPTPPPGRSSQPLNFKVRQVSLDLMNNKGYTELRLERRPGQDVPEELWVTTVFFTPAHPGIIGMSKVKINPAQSAQSDFVVVASNVSSSDRNMFRPDTQIIPTFRMKLLFAI